MNNLKSSSQSQGNVQQQMMIIFEKLDIVTKQVNKL
jgi:hypothetical protein